MLIRRKTASIMGLALLSLMLHTTDTYAEIPAWYGTERALTTSAEGHVLTNANVWSPDGSRIVYDVRTGDRFDGTRIATVELSSGRIQTLFESRQGACCGVATFSPVDERVVFILGPEHPSPDWNYSFTHRRGFVVETASPGTGRPLDAMNYAPPFVSGALRGGSHVHVFSPDGRWVSFTYEDEVLARLDAAPNAPAHEPNQRNVGIAVPGGPVSVARNHPRNNDGDWFSVLVTRTVAVPRPGSDEISRAYEEGWIGVDGYVRIDGSRQKRALAFLGLVTAASGTRHAEVFVADLPEQLGQSGGVALGGTETTRPSPPPGIVQRRLTFTSERLHPGVTASPRHWLRSSPDGSLIAFLMQDDAGVVQFWTVAPRGGSPLQLTRNEHGISSAFTWSPDGHYLAHTCDGSVCVTDTATGETRRLTPRRVGADAPLPLACVFSPDGRRIAFQREVSAGAARFPQIFIVTLP
jgi:WD40 repeat protein